MIRSRPFRHPSPRADEVNLVDERDCRFRASTSTTTHRRVRRATAPRDLLVVTAGRTRRAARRVSSDAPPPAHRVGRMRMRPSTAGRDGAGGRDGLQQHLGGERAALGIDDHAPSRNAVIPSPPLAT
jgi:hypothetical protein